ncbi:hypothetical protein [Bradyrhizobium elkanii]|uniref:hypothetical protein n=1 Tax=Bradyrhizobium elkanii TaxID=29448 RepID=UPI003D1E7D10
MTPDEEENAVRQLGEIIGFARIAEIAQRLAGRRFDCGDDECWTAGKCLKVKDPCWASKRTPGA